MFKRRQVISIEAKVSLFFAESKVSAAENLKNASLWFPVDNV